MNNIIRFELKSNLRNTIIWTLSAIGVMILFASMYPTFQEQASSFEELLKAYPPEVIKSLNLSLETFSTVIGFYTFTCIYTMIIIALFASTLTVKSFSYEKTKKIYEYLLTKPVTRSNVFVAKLISNFLLFTVGFVLFYIASIITMSAISSDAISYSALFNINVAIYFIGLFFFAIGTLIATALSKVKVVSAITLPLVFGFFFLSILKSLLDDDKLKYLSPFSMFDINEVAQTGIQLNVVVLVLALSAIFIGIAYSLFIKKDIR